MIVRQHNVIIREQFCRTFGGKNHFARSLTVCGAARQLLGDSPPGEQLWSTLWGLNYSFSMATCIQLAWDCGEDFTSCSSALPDSLSDTLLHHAPQKKKYRLFQILCRHSFAHIYYGDYLYKHDKTILYMKCFMICGLFWHVCRMSRDLKIIVSNGRLWLQKIVLLQWQSCRISSF